MSVAQHHSQEDTRVIELESRKGLYRFFQNVFYEEPDLPMLHQLSNPALAGVFPLLGINTSELDGADPESLEKLAVEYTRLFIGPGKHISLHESVQRKAGGMLNNKYTAEVRRFYMASGYQFNSDKGIYPDHLCTELEFMDSLINIQMNTFKTGDLRETESAGMLQEEFMRLHLSQWIPDFCDRVIEDSRSIFYRDLAKSLSDFMELEKQLLMPT